MAGHATADDASCFLPERGSLTALRKAAAQCRGCDLYQNTTQTVFGEGAATARLVLVGEQPGDQEDRAGEPFVGPAGRLLNKALAEVGIERRAAYLTNAVKHFKFVRPERGKRRIHQRPSRAEVLACLPWLVAELRAVRPEIVVCLGATAAGALLGPSFRLTAHRGELLDTPETIAGETRKRWRLTATVHPSSVLRSPDRDRAYEYFVNDLCVVADALA